MRTQPRVVTVPMVPALHWGALKAIHAHAYGPRCRGCADEHCTAMLHVPCCQPPRQMPGATSQDRSVRRQGSGKFKHSFSAATAPVPPPLPLTLSCGSVVRQPSPLYITPPPPLPFPQPTTRHYCVRSLLRCGRA